MNDLLSRLIAADLISKRFIGLLLCVAAVLVGFFFGPAGLFGTLATAVGGMFVTFAGVQSYTDAQEKKP